MPWILKHPRHSRRKSRGVTNVNATLGAMSLSLYTFPRARTRNRLIQTGRNRREDADRQMFWFVSARTGMPRVLFPLIRVARRTRAVGMLVGL